MAFYNPSSENVDEGYSFNRNSQTKKFYKTQRNCVEDEFASLNCNRLYQEEKS